MEGKKVPQNYYSKTLLPLNPVMREQLKIVVKEKALNQSMKNIRICDVIVTSPVDSYLNSPKLKNH